MVTSWKNLTMRVVNGTVTTFDQYRYYRPDVGPTWAQPKVLSDWLGNLGCGEGYTYGQRTQPSQRTTEAMGCMQLGGVLLGCVQFG